MKDSEINGLFIRRMTNIHIPMMLRVEQSSRENFWNKEVFTKHLRGAGHAGCVVIHDDDLAGFIAYEHASSYIQIWNLVVARKFRKRGVAQLLLKNLQEVSQDCDGIRFNVRESNLAAQLLLKKMGFYCDTIAQDYFIDETIEEVRVENAYCFDYSKKTREKCDQIRITDRLGAVVATIREKPRMPFGVPDWQTKL